MTKDGPKPNQAVAETRAAAPVLPKTRIPSSQRRGEHVHLPLIDVLYMQEYMHQWNLQLHLSTTSTSCVWKPRPQHISSQPSMAFDVRLHWRPTVPSMPGVRGSKSQKSGLGSRTLVVPALRCSTSVAPSNFSLMTLPTLRKGGMAFQQVLTSQDPDTPWHLHSTRMWDKMACGEAREGFSEQKDFEII
ncbi:hypothetical protein EYF80_011142 [Liparis tanakae]|uniref:Uncharacterized protein n=1 Tax=Liparis tanakae TaxID=230148 RepID=A0A4Z2ILB4_9TELE|nr:hypothetical protein EYF80_011142 [Liparis tanakae]